MDVGVRKQELLEKTKQLLSKPPPSSLQNSPRGGTGRGPSHHHQPLHLPASAGAPAIVVDRQEPLVTPRDAALAPSCPGSALSVTSIEPWDGAPPSFSVPVTPLSTEKPRSPSAEVGAELAKVAERVGWGPSVSFSRRGAQRPRGIVADEALLPRRAASAGKSHVQELFGNDENSGANGASRGHPSGRMRAGRQMPLASQSWGKAFEEEDEEEEDPQLSRLLSQRGRQVLNQGYAAQGHGRGAQPGTGTAGPHLSSLYSKIYDLEEGAAAEQLMMWQSALEGDTKAVERSPAGRVDSSRDRRAPCGSSLLSFFGVCAPEPAAAGGREYRRGT